MVVILLLSPLSLTTDWLFRIIARHSAACGGVAYVSRAWLPPSEPLDGGSLGRSKLVGPTLLLTVRDTADMRLGFEGESGLGFWLMS